MKTAVSKSEATPSLPKVITAENIHLFPENIQEAYRVLKKHKNTIKAPEKYFPSQKRHIIEKAEELFKGKPELPLKEGIISILQDLPDFLPADNLVQVVGYVVQVWEGR